jgi:hypothetical protein
MMPPVRRSLAVLLAALLAGLLAVAGISAPANAAPKISLSIVSVTDIETHLGGPVTDPDEVVGPVKGRPFEVGVEVVGGTVPKDTTITLQATGTGTLSGTTTGVIPANGSRAIISGAIYSAYENGVVLTVSASPGGSLNPAKVTVEVALTATSKVATPEISLEVTDSTCIEPTAGRPTCGQIVLPNGAQGRVILSLGSCEGLGKCKEVGTAGSTTEALVVTAIATLKDLQNEPLYDRSHPATLIIGCDKSLCRETANGVPKMPVIYTLENTGSLDKVAPPCPAKGVIGDTLPEPVCVDYVSSSRSQGDLYMHLLYAIDIRGSM